MCRTLILFLSLTIVQSIFGQCPDHLSKSFSFDESSGAAAYSQDNFSIINLQNASWDLGIINSAVKFNGPNSEGNLINSFLNWEASSEFSISLWVKVDSLRNGITTVFLGRDENHNLVHWWIGLQNTSGNVIFFLRDAFGTMGRCQSYTSLVVGEWYHIVAERNALENTNSLYINGNLESSSNVRYTGSFASSSPLNLGYLEVDGIKEYHSICSIDELNFHSIALPPDTVAAYFQRQQAGQAICQSIPEPDASDTLKIMPLGNSITFDTYSNDIRPFGERPGYRKFLYDKLDSAGYHFDFIGSENTGENLFPDGDNAGFPGINVNQLLHLIKTGYNQRTNTQETQGPYFDYYLPDVILLHIGTNDLTTDASWLNEFLDILDSLRLANNKTIKLVLAKIINRANYHYETSIYNQNLEQIFNSRPHPDNYLIDMENGAGIIYSTDMIDNLHPNSAGYYKMAANWFSHLTYVLPTPNSNLIKAPLITSISSKPLQAIINWTDNSDNDDGFEIFVKQPGSSSFQFVGITSQGVHSFTHPVSVGNGTYAYKVRAVNAVTSSAFSEEMSVFIPGDVTDINLAPGKSVSQSSTAYGGVPERAIDGNTNGSWSAGSVTHTKGDPNCWWEIDLGEIASISSIEIWNRTDCCMDRLANYHVMISSVPFLSKDLNFSLNQSGVWSTFSSNYPNPSQTFNPATTGRYIRIQCANLTELNLAEVKIFGSTTDVPPPSPTIPVAPTMLNPNGVTSDYISFEWNDNSNNEDGFVIDRDSGSGFIHFDTVPAGVINYVDYAVTEDTQYSYRIIAYNNVGESDYSNSISIKTKIYRPTQILLSEGKSVSQSSTLYGGVPERAIDGNTNGSWSAGSVTHTKGDVNAWWEIDLGAVFNITDMQIWNRTDGCCSDRLSDYYVLISDNTFDSKDLPQTLNQAGVWSHFYSNSPNPNQDLSPNISGRYVRIQCTNPNELNLAEVMIFGTESNVPPPVPTIPNAPSNLTSDEIASNRVSFTWMDNANNENGFVVDRDLGSGFSTIDTLRANSTQYSDNSVLAGNQYSYRIAAFNALRLSGYSNSIQVNIPVPGTTPVLLTAGKSVTQSSTAYGGVPERAIDGNTNGSWSAGSVTHTNGDVNAWWEIDLGEVYNITDVQIWNRTDGCCRDRLSDYYVLINNNTFDSKDLTQTMNQSGVWSQFYSNSPNPNQDLSPNISGRYVRIQCANPTELNLSEVIIKGLPVSKSTEELSGNELVTFRDITAFPNPTEDRISISYNLTNQAKVTIDLFDITGQRINILRNHIETEGQKLISLNLDEYLEINQGILLIRFTAISETKWIKVVLE